jgi:aminoglycoside/choline kinase family phosphotransferase
MSSEELGVFGNQGPSELPFLNVARFLRKLTDAVPRIYGAYAPEGGLVLEDVGDVSLWEASNASKASGRDLFWNALAFLKDLQERAVDDGTGCLAFQQAFDARLFGWEFEHFLEYGLNPVRDTDRSRCHDELMAVAERLGKLPRAFCHRDYHAWNIHVQNGHLRLLDFQDALLGPRLYDVASLLTDRSTPQAVDERRAEDLVRRFAEGLPVGGDPIEVYHLLAFQRVLKVIGRFNFLAERKGKPRYLQMLPGVVETARRLAARISGIDRTRSLLDRAVKAGPATAR